MVTNVYSIGVFYDMNNTAMGAKKFFMIKLPVKTFFSVPTGKYILDFFGIGLLFLLSHLNNLTQLKRISGIQNYILINL